MISRLWPIEPRISPRGLRRGINPEPAGAAIQPPTRISQDEIDEQESPAPMRRALCHLGSSRAPGWHQGI
jgi:hypothetical protein